MRCVTTTTGVLALASVASAWSKIIFNNWCAHDVFMYQSVQGNCAAGVNGLCYTAHGSKPFRIRGGNGQASLLPMTVIEGKSVSIKISTIADWSHGQPTLAQGGGILQFEYTAVDKFWWDISMVNGDPFAAQNIKATPTGDGSKDPRFDTCRKVACPANKPCHNVYHEPSDNWATRSCPATTGTFWVDLCEPMPWFGNKQRRGLPVESDYE